MTGITSYGAVVSVRGDGPEPHPLKHATLAEIRSTVIATFRAARVPMARVALAMRRSERQCRYDNEVPTVGQLRGGRPDAATDAVSHSLRHASVAQICSTVVRSLRAAGRDWRTVALAMRCSEETARTDSLVPPVGIDRSARCVDAA